MSGGGPLTQFFLYALIVAGSIAALSEVIRDVQRAIGASNRLLELLRLQSQVRNPEAPFAPGKRHHQAISIEIQNLSFHSPSIPTKCYQVSLWIFRLAKRLPSLDPLGQENRPCLN